MIRPSERCPTAYYGVLLPAAVGFYFVFGAFISLLLILPFFDITPADIRVILRAQVHQATQTLSGKGR
jgi:hypothetical protein